METKGQGWVRHVFQDQTFEAGGVKKHSPTNWRKSGKPILGKCFGNKCHASLGVLKD